MSKYEYQMIDIRIVLLNAVCAAFVAATAKRRSERAACERIASRWQLTPAASVPPCARLHAESLTISAAERAHDERREGLYQRCKPPHRSHGHRPRHQQLRTGIPSRALRRTCSRLEAN